MLFVVASAKVPSVIVLDTTWAQANARAGWNARRYGVTFFVAKVETMPCYCGKDVPLINGAVADEFGVYCNEVCLDASNNPGDGSWSAEAADAYYSFEANTCDSHDAINCSLCGTYM